ncbi:hypothetical protein [Salirhabdus salicampi]|uniref:hypothetical protein n=1 Tax=Salirhabdus salicampi TaxID=476102 RepID=UPI0020C456E6|nr:hypothetical protein [Salirhabdus salicampi]MCP8617953.1 hypothetical protein [Salirhabdus salicampi]
MKKEVRNVMILVIGLILVALSRFPIMSPPIAISVGVIGAIVIIFSAILLFKNKKSTH